MRGLILSVCTAPFVLYGPAFAGEKTEMTMRLDPVTRYVHIAYEVPKDAPDEVTVCCCWSPPGKADWRPANVRPLISETALRLATDEQWRQWTLEGRITERRAAGLKRTVVFNPYPEAQRNGVVDADFRIEIATTDGRTLSSEAIRVQADNRDVVYIEDWRQVLQRDAVVTGPADGKWSWREGLDGLTLGNALYGNAGTPLPQLAYPLDLRGSYAVFVCTKPGDGSIGLRLTGDERTEYLSSRHPFEEVLWRPARMDHQHLVLKQRYTYSGWGAAHIDYLKLVPLSEELVKRLEDQFAGKKDKFIAGYFEPYSWAFNENILNTLQHREPLTAFAEAGVDLVDIQIGRFGAKVVYESRVTDQLLYGTIGDPIDGVIPETGNVGRMQQYTNTLQAELKYARELGLTPHANFGATNCYVGTPLQGDITKQHPDWIRGHTLRYELPEVRAYILSLIREALELGAPGISIDFCRYPEGIDKAETCNTFLRELRKLADERGDGRRVPVLIRFPAKGVRLWERFDYRTWVREGLVDYLCPSNIQGRHLHFDIGPYVKAVKGTKCKLLPVVDGLSWGPVRPGPFLWRVKQLYDAGADGIYIYQADDLIVYQPTDRQYARLAGSTEALGGWWERDGHDRPICSKGIYVTPPAQGKVYHRWERLRIWLEGIRMGEVEMYLDRKLVSRYDGPPYVLGTEEYESDGVIPPGEHILLVRARDGDGWLEQTFAIRGAE